MDDEKDRWFAAFFCNDFFLWQPAVVQKPRKDRRSSLILYLYSRKRCGMEPEIILLI